MPLKLTSEGDSRLIVTRAFAAPPMALYQAHVDPILLQQWCIGPDGWRMIECQSQPRPGGSLLYRWADGQGHGFYLTGEYLEIEPGRRILHQERMFLPERSPENRVESYFHEAQGGTLLRVVMDLPDSETRAAMLASGMARGMEDSYRRLDAMLL